jgi:hypothetical protein
MEETIQDTNKLANVPMEDLGQMLHRHPYSANLRWEIIKRKLVKGEISDEELARESLYMNDQKAFFSEVEKIKFALSANDLRENLPPTATDQRRDSTSGQPVESVDPVEVNLSGVNEGEPVIRTEREDLPEVEKEPDMESEASSGEVKHHNVDVEKSAGSLADPDSPFEDKQTVQERREAEDQKPEGELPKKEERNTLEDHVVKPPESSFETESDTEEELSDFVKWLKRRQMKHTDDETVSRKDIGSDGAEQTDAPKAEVDKTVKKDKPKDGKKKKKKKKKDVRKAGEIELQPDIASETLADLLASQGHLEEANEMYKRLSLLYPEKSSYFASKIKKD